MRPESQLGDQVARFRELANGGMSAVKKDPPSVEEWSQISTFMLENLPNRWAEFIRIRGQRGEGAPVVQNIRTRIAIRYRALKYLETQFPTFYKGAVEQASTEDKVWGILLNVRQNPSDAALRDELRANVRRLVELVIQQRAARLDRLAKMVEEEKRLVDQDRDNIDQVVELQSKRLLSSEDMGGPIETGRLMGGVFVPNPRVPASNDRQERAGPTTRRGN